MIIPRPVDYTASDNVKHQTHHPARRVHTSSGALQEIDYTLEGESADRFRKNFAAEDWLKVPRIYWERTTSEVLTMEYCPGVKINRVAELDKLGVDRKRLAKLAVESYLQQILTYGFFHAGNVLGSWLCLWCRFAQTSPERKRKQPNCIEKL